MAVNITPNKFYNLFIKEVRERRIEGFWDNDKRCTAELLVGSKCVMERIAKKLGLKYSHEYFSLDGVFYKQLETENPFNGKSIEGYGYAKNIKIIVEVENYHRTLFKEIYKLIPLFVAPTVVLVTYLDTRDIYKVNDEIEKMMSAIKKRIGGDELGLYKKKIKTILIVGYKNNGKVAWKGLVYYKGKFKSLI